MLHATRILAATSFALAFAGCFDPSYQNTECSSAGECPPGFTCDTDTNRCVTVVGDRDASAIDAPPGAIDANLIDAFQPPDAPPDAMPVECTGDSQCQDPPSPCLEAGTCNLTTNKCEFPAVDCSSMDSTCTIGVCEAGTGNCVAQPAHENDTCSTSTVDSCGSCGGFTGECGEDGTKSCTCTDYTCQSGACMPSATTCDQACTRSTTGNSCGAGQTVDSCGSCGGFSSTCDNTGNKSCTCTDFTCGGGTCNAGAPFTCSQACTRNTNGTACGAGVGEVITSGTCQYSSACDESGTTTGRTCRDNTCSSGSCSAGGTYACNQSCSRNTDGNVCGTQSCGTGRIRDTCCSAGSCNDPCGICECITCASEPTGYDE